MDPNLACTNEAAPYGESPEPTRPDTQTEDTLTLAHGHARADTLAHRESKGHAAPQ